MPLTHFSREFEAYALVSGALVDADVEFDCYLPTLADKLIDFVEQSVNYHYHAEPPLCGSCQEGRDGSQI